ncbi:hypothetical protein [Roseburia inulinivorans]|uniref:DUF2029 domain-containing protein n=1 Tax=Roseburia inulinivorans TaxID=360807 RepID=A0A3R5VUE7_9FIRM|nr:hypothetical protein [Roseburia inulinivorans]RGQ48168.1 hypothetical protein DWY96_10260 [Roseburia inulinivorans]
MKRLKTYLTDEHGVYKWEWVVLGLLLMIPFISFAYGDLKSIIHYEINFTGSILKGGGLQNFYTYCMNQVKFYIDHSIEGVSYATYDFPMYIVLGIWGIPLYIYEQIIGIDPTYFFWPLFYGKSIYIVALVISAYLIYRICKELGINSQNSIWGSFGFASSILVVANVCIIGQSDILGIVWILLGILALLQKKEWKFVIYFMIAISFKQFALFIFVPLLLLTDKRIIRIIGKMIVAVSLTLVSGIPFYGNTEAMEIKKKFSNEMLEMLTAAKIPFLNREIPLVIILLGGLCLFCFLKNELMEEDLRKKYIIYISFLSMGIVFSSFDFNPYWGLYLAPFLAIVLVANTSETYHNFLLETIGMGALTLAHYSAYSWCYDISNTKAMFWNKLFGALDYEGFWIRMNMVTKALKIDDYCDYIFAVYLLCLWAILWKNRPEKIRITDQKINYRRLMVQRLAVNMLIVAIPFGFIFLNIAAFVMQH